MDKKQEKQVRKAAKRQTQAQPRKVTLTAKQICGPALWSKLSKGDRLRAGAYLYKLVRQNKLPLVCAGKTSSNHLLYQLM